jgi:hypothetical protein
MGQFYPIKTQIDMISTALNFQEKLITIANGKTGEKVANRRVCLSTKI